MSVLKRKPRIYCDQDHKRPDGQATMLIAKHTVLRRRDDTSYAAETSDRWLDNPYCIFCGPRGPHR